MTTPSVEVLLPTYNGARYLDEQLESLCNQTFTSFTTLTYDDGSNDASYAIVDRYADRLSIKRVPNSDKCNRGAVKSFELLMTHSTAEILLFCDQDDIWDATKIEEGVSALKKAAATYGDIPIAVFSDLSLFSDTDTSVSGLFLAANGFNPAARTDPYYLTFRNAAPGCTLTINRTLLRAALPLPSQAHMHDWWLMLIASLSGKIVFIDKPLLRYRIHAANTLGISHDKPMHPLASMISLLKVHKLRAVLSTIAPNVAQGKAAFIHCNKPFLTLLFWGKFIAGRYLFPGLAKLNRYFLRFSWKRP